MLPMVLAFMLAAAVSGLLGKYLRFLGENWRLFEVWVAFCVLSLSSLGISALGPDTTEAMLYGALGGGGAFLVFLFMRCRPELLGLCRCDARWLFRSAVVAVFTVAASMLWILLLDAVGWKGEDQLLVQEMADVTGDERNLLFLYTIVGAPIIEEFLFRGFFWKPLREHVPFSGALIINAALFGALHFDTPHTVPFLMGFGAVLVWLRVSSGSLLPALSAHVLNNGLVCLTVVYGL